MARTPAQERSRGRQAAAAAARLRPSPPRLGPFDFVPAPELRTWALETFVAESGALHNPAHLHLQQAHVGFLWTAVENVRQGRQVLGQAEMPNPKGGKWAIARQEFQLRSWFGPAALDFLITIDADYAGECSDAEFCALVEHELLHCAQAKDEFGGPRFNRDTGRPIYAMRGHDVEEFADIVSRYGADAAGVRAFVEAASRPPLLEAKAIAGACGTCVSRAA